MPAHEEEVTRIIDAARQRGTHLRVIGGLAVKLHSPSAEHRGLARTYGDVDLVGYRHQRKDIARVLEDLGYEPNVRFNTLQGNRRLLFESEEKGFDVDVFLDIFPMSHDLDFKDRLEVDEYTVPIEELLLSKLQVVEINDKDIQDTLAMLHDHEIGEGDSKELLDSQVITRITSDDWGWYKTVTLNLDKIREWTGDFLSGEKERRLIHERIERLRNLIEEAPKSLRWKARARIGEKVQWYNLPEDIAEVHK
ncbi:MAG: hypothetical protein ACE5NC_10045 [Anaerolineae bacterium]